MRQRLRRKSLWAVGVCLALVSGGCVPGESVDDSSAPKETVEQELESGEVGALKGDELAWEHSMQRTNPLPDGRLPMVDTLDGPHGGRYGVVKEIRGAQDDHSTGMTRSTGVVELQSRWMSAEQRTARAVELGKPERPTDAEQVPPTLSASFVEELTQRQADEQLLVSIRLVKPQWPLMAHRIEEAAARGQIGSRADYDRLRAQFKAEKQQRVAEHQAPVREAIEAMGGQVVALYANVWGLAASLTPAQIQRLASRPDVAFIEPDAEGHNNEVTGIEVTEGSQLSQFTDSSLSPVYNGENPGGSNDITFAMMEAGEPDDTHVGFEEGEGYTWSRFRAKYRCDNSLCWPVSSYTSPIDHTSAVAGLVIGDLNDGQDSGVISLTERRKRSGYANEGRGYPFNLTTSNTTSGTLALNNMQSLGVHPHVANVSWGSSTGDPTCSGTGTFNAAANDLFENDTLPIITAGNVKGSSTNCTIDAPASAIGVFTVGAHADTDTSSGDETDVRGAPIWNCPAAVCLTEKESAMGGVSYSEGHCCVSSPHRIGLHLA